jgi:hypothetical protein
MYGLVMNHVCHQLGNNIAQTILNVKLSGNKIGKVSNLTLEFNLLGV